MKDPIVEETHRVRERLLEECGGSLEKLMDRLKSRESEDEDRLVARVEASGTSEKLET